MAKKYSITRVSDPATRLRLMHEAITELRRREKFALVITHQIMTFIDGLARSKRGKTAAGFDPMVKTVLPRLCALVPASELRQSFRNKLVHAFGIAHPYALGWKENAYVHRATVLGQKWQVIDVYEMTNEFLAYLKTPAALAEQKRRQKP